MALRLTHIAAVASLLFAMTAEATSYYVSTSGHDANRGTRSAPFRTLRRAAGAVRPGDVVNVRGGIYRENVRIGARGTASRPIIFRSMPGELAVLDGTQLGPETPLVVLDGTEHVSLSGFEIRNTKNIAVVLWHARHTRVVDNHIHHAARNGIYAGGDTTVACAYVTVSGNRIHDTALENERHTMQKGWPGAVVISRTEHAAIENNRIWNNHGEGLISLRSSYARIRDNEIFDNFSAGLYLDNARFVTADRNRIYSTGNTRFFRDGKPGIGIGVANESKDVMNLSSNNVFTNNVVSGTRWGFYYGSFENGGGLRNTQIVNNRFQETTDEVIRIENDSHVNTLVANNVFYQTGSPPPRYAGGAGVTYRNNVWYGGPAGAAAGKGDRISP